MDKPAGHIAGPRHRLWHMAIIGILSCGIGGLPDASAQQFEALKRPAEPVALADFGSFFIGGDSVEQSEVEAGRNGSPGKVTVGQMYVEYMIPANASKVPVIMVHGGTLTGKTFDTTPDGRMGWKSYFVRLGYPSYIVDQVGFGRSGFNQSVINRVRAGLDPSNQLPNISRFNDRLMWLTFLIGPAPGVAYPDTQFPVEAFDQVAKQGVPDIRFNATSNTQAPVNHDPTLVGMSDLAAKLGGAVLLGHAGAGNFPPEAALLSPEGIKGLIMIEPGATTCKGRAYSDEQIKSLAKLPILVVFGDHLNTNVGQPALPYLWQTSFEDCQLFVSRLNQAGGKAKMLSLPEKGIRGNSLMMMLDKNNIQVADLISQWIEMDVPKH